MRSSWELNFAKWCDLSGIEWVYESKTFELGNTTYTPDFYLPEFDLWIEIKGYWRDDARIKFKKFKRLYKTINIEVFDKLILKRIGII
jgi:predicted nuclease of restriction endonuclease-like RecB superfamily